MILALEKELPGITPGQFSPFLKEEALQVWKLYQAGIIREIYFHAKEHTAVMMLECSGMDQAQEVLASLPLVQASLITFEIIPLAPYDGFERLFQI
jgi:muconolactone delta-isomerase